MSDASFFRLIVLIGEATVRSVLLTAIPNVFVPGSMPISLFFWQNI